MTLTLANDLGMSHDTYCLVITSVYYNAMVQTLTVVGGQTNGHDDSIKGRLNIY